MRRIFILGALVALAAPVSAQTVTCTSWGNQTTCSQPPPVTQFNLGRALETNQRLRAGQAAQEAYQADAAARAAQDSRNRMAGQMVAEGRCEDARAFALNSGDLSLAQQVNGLCQAPPK